SKHVKYDVSPEAEDRGRSTPSRLHEQEQQLNIAPSVQQAHLGVRNVDVRYAQSLDAFHDICNCHAVFLVGPLPLSVIETLKTFKLSPNVEHCILSITDLSIITVANNKWVELSADEDFYRVIF